MKGTRHSRSSLLSLKCGIYIFPKSELKENGRNQRGKSISKNQKWTKKMSNFQKRKYFMKKVLKIRHSEHYGLSHQKNNYKIMMTNFNTFLEKEFRDFFCYHINGKNDN
jgi:hypothetical protein